jgi:phosphinothricin acetyltransferase
MAPGDWPAVRAIYEAGIATRNATFETEAPTWERWDAGHLPDQRLVAVDRSGVIGWAALSPVSARHVYRGVAEHSVYIAPEARGRGVGRLVLGALIESAERAGIWTIQTGIFPENAASLALHAACGFRVVGIREHVGQLDGQWRDVAFLERRSSIVGVDQLN